MTQIHLFSLRSLVSGYFITAEVKEPKAVATQQSAVDGPYWTCLRRNRLCEERTDGVSSMSARQLRVTPTTVCREFGLNPDHTLASPGSCGHTTARSQAGNSDMTDSTICTQEFLKAPRWFHCVAKFEMYCSRVFLRRRAFRNIMCTSS